MPCINTLGARHEIFLKKEAARGGNGWKTVGGKERERSEKGVLEKRKGERTRKAEEKKVESA